MDKKPWFQFFCYTNGSTSDREDAPRTKSCESGDHLRDIWRWWISEKLRWLLKVVIYVCDLDLILLFKINVGGVVLIHELTIFYRGIFNIPIEAHKMEKFNFVSDSKILNFTILSFRLFHQNYTCISMHPTIIFSRRMVGFPGTLVEKKKVKGRLRVLEQGRRGRMDGWTPVLESRGLRRARNRSLRGKIMEDQTLWRRFNSNDARRWFEAGSR